MRGQDIDPRFLTKRRPTTAGDMLPSSNGTSPSASLKESRGPPSMLEGGAAADALDSFLEYRKNVGRRLHPRRRNTLLSTLLTLFAGAALLLILLSDFSPPAGPLIHPLRLLLLSPRGPAGGGGGGGRRGLLDEPPLATGGRGFIYVYDFGPAFTADVLKRNTSWWSVQYEAERTFHELLLAGGAGGGPYVTLDPTEATLFYVPFYAAYYLNTVFLDAEVNMKEAVEATSQMWGRVLRRVKEYPYFSRSNGQDHFSFLTMDHGRCTALTFLDPAEYGDMFFLQLNGDRMVRSNYAHPRRGMQALTYNYRARLQADIPDIACYMASAGGKDIVIPPVVRNLPVVSPFSEKKNVTVLFRFSPGQHHGEPIPHHGHFIRQELYEMYANKSIEGWSFAMRSQVDTNGEWSSSIFCPSPPGHSQWTSRPSKAILSGCIPITFYRDHDSPWQGLVNWDEFSLNIDPDQLWMLQERVEEVMRNASQLQRMQQALLKYQNYFLWSDDLERGAEQIIIRLLWERGQTLRRTRRDTRMGGGRAQSDGGFRFHRMLQ